MFKHVLPPPFFLGGFVFKIPFQFQIISVSVWYLFLVLFPDPHPDPGRVWAGDVIVARP